MYAFGLFRRAEDGTEVLVGATLWMPPTKVCGQSVAQDDWRSVLALSRTVVAPGEPTNAASLLLGASIRAIRKAGVWRHLVTYADESQGHTGAIYKATNWEYVEKTGPYPMWLDQTGKMVARKAGPKTRTDAEMTALGHRMVGKFFKHKFVMHLTDAAW